MTTSTETQTLTRVGDRLALLLDDALLARLGITAETPLKVTQAGGGLLVAPRPAVADPISDDEFDAVVRQMMTRYESTFRRLAE